MIVSDLVYVTPCIIESSAYTVCKAWILSTNNNLNLAVVTAYCVLNLISDSTKDLFSVSRCEFIVLYGNWASEVYTRINAFWDTTLCRFVSACRCLRGAYCLKILS
jgi:hypothetical protein